MNDSVFKPIRIRRAGGIDDVPSLAVKKVEVIKKQIEDIPFQLCPWNSSEYKNYFGCRVNEHPLDAINDMLMLLNSCKMGDFKKCVNNYKSSKRYLVTTNQHNVLFQKCLYIGHFL